jgi:glycosyltransferase involved in cell wall biosynthesis/thymidylate kinase
MESRDDVGVDEYGQRDGAVTALAAKAVARLPVRSIEVDLDEGWPQVTGSAQGPSYAGGIQALIRLHGCPTGLVVAPLPEAGFTPRQFEELVSPVVAEAVMAHRWHDEQPVAGPVIGSVGASAAALRCQAVKELLNASGPALDVVIPTRNRPDRLADCVDSILATGYRHVRVIVVDNAPSGPETADLVAGRSDWASRVRYVREDRPGVSLARNRGVKCATAEFVAFVDDDVVVDRGWAAGLVSAFLDEPEAGCVTGPIIAAELDTQAQMWIEEYGGFCKGFVRHVFDPLDSQDETPLFPYAAGTYGSGANMAFRRETIVKIHSFDPALGIGMPARGGEDLAAFACALLAGRRLVYEPSMMVKHRHHRSYEKLRQVILAYGVGLGAYLAKTVYDRPSTLLSIVRRVPPGLGYLFRPDSTKNAHKSADYPRELTVRELAGLAWGPFAYAAGRFELRRRNRRPEGSVPPRPPDADARTSSRADLPAPDPMALLIGFRQLLTVAGPGQVEAAPVSSLPDSTARNVGIASRAEPLAPAATLQSRAFGELTRAGVQWAMLRPSSVLEPGDDVDVLVAPSDYGVARSVLLNFGFLQLPGRGRGSHRFFLGHDSSRGDWLALDVVTELAYGPRFEFKTNLGAACLERRSGSPARQNLDPDDELYSLLLHCLLDKGVISPKRASKLEQLVVADREAGPVRHLLAGLLPSEWTAERLEQAIRAGEWARLESLGRPISRRLRRRDPLGSMRRTLGRSIVGLIEPLLLLKRPGLTVALVGPDGAGKSTLAERIENSLGLPVRRIYMGLWQRRSSRLPNFVGVFEILFRPFRIWGRYLRAVGHRRLGRVVVFDRYPLDATLPPKGRLVRLKLIYFWFLAHCAPAPDLLVILDAPGELLFARKGEEDPVSLERDRRYFRALAERVKNSVIVDVSPPEADVFEQVDRAIWDRLTQRKSGSSATSSRLVARIARRGGAAGVSSAGRASRRFLGFRRRTRANNALDLVMSDLRAQSFMPESWSAGRLSVTETGVGMFQLGPPEGPAQFMVKVPLCAWAEGALKTHVQVVTRLSADPRLADWSKLLPVIRGEGRAGELSYVVEGLLPGQPASSLVKSGKGAAALRASAQAITGLHEQTGERLCVDDAVVESWVWDPVHAVCAALPAAGRSGWRSDALERIGQNVASALKGRDVQVAWVHGDYWPGNVLVAEDGSTVTGIVDWGFAEPKLPLLHDSIDLILFARRIQQRRDLGFLARAMLEDSHLDQTEDYVLRTVGLGWPADVAGVRLAVVLAWLHHIGSVAGVGGEVQNPWWVRQNLDPLLKSPLPSLYS